MTRTRSVHTDVVERGEGVCRGVLEHDGETVTNTVWRLFDASVGGIKNRLLRTRCESTVVSMCGDVRGSQGPENRLSGTRKDASREKITIVGASVHCRSVCSATQRSFEVAWVSFFDRVGQRRPLKPLRMAHFG